MFDKNKVIEELNKSFVLLMNKPSLEYMGILLYGTNVKIIDSQELNESWGKSCLAYTDGKNINILYNFDPKAHPKMAEEGLDYKELAFILCHEMIHIISYHIERRGDRDPVIWNLSIDHCTNRSLLPYVDRGLLKMPEGAVFFEDIHGDYPEITPEELYNLLIKEKEEIQSQVGVIVLRETVTERLSGGDDDNSDDGEGEKDQKEEGDGETSQTSSPTLEAVEVTRKGKKYYIAPREVTEDSSSSDTNAQKEKEEIRQKAKYIWSANDGTIIQKGEMPSSLVSEINELFKVKVPWENVLNSALLYTSQEMTSLSWKSKNYYIRCTNLPGLSYGVSPQTAVFVIDTSGSISDGDLKKFVGIVCDSCNYFDKIRIIQHDV
ncbi:MAG: DUF2201 family putative metallopeptidase, partial [Brevinematales bacterium]